MKRNLLFFLILFFAITIAEGGEKPVVIPSNGVYVFTKTGEFVVPDSWDIQQNNNVIGVALITENTKALIALTDVGKKTCWGPDGLVSGIVKTEMNSSNSKPGVAASDYNGFSNTDQFMASLLPSDNTAISMAANYVFPNGDKGYLPALGELIDAYSNIEEINKLLEKVGGEQIITGTNDDWYWTSSQHYLEYRAWSYGGFDSDNNRWFAQLRNENSPLVDTYGTALCRVRAFAQIPSSVPSVPTNSSINGREWVDLNLPSGTLWATCNIGANIPEEVGGYFAWGETAPKTHFDISNYQYYVNNKYQDIGNDIAGTIYDAAKVNWGEEWRMPTLDELKELSTYCTRSSYNLNGVPGLLFKGSNGNTIFIPNGGIDYENGGVPSESDGCGVWSSTTMNSNCAYRAWEWNSFSLSFSYKYQGLPVRAVCNVALQCSQPIIRYVNGKLRFTCETEDVVYHYDIRSLNAANYEISGEGNDIELQNTYIVSVYASKDGYRDSETATMELKLTAINGDLNSDGVVNAADVVKLVNIISGQ